MTAIFMIVTGETRSRPSGQAALLCLFPASAGTWVVASDAGPELLFLFPERCHDLFSRIPFSVQFHEPVQWSVRNADQLKQSRTKDVVSLFPIPGNAETVFGAAPVAEIQVGT